MNRIAEAAIGVLVGMSACSWVTAQDAAAPSGKITRCEEIIPAPAEQIFDGFTNSEGIIRLWGVAQAEVDFRVGGQIRTRYDKEKKLDEPGAIVNTILAYEPGRMLAIKASAPDGAPEWLKLICSTGWSVLRLEPLDATHTRITCTGMGYGDGPEYDQARDFFDKGNRWTLERMKAQFSGETPQPSSKAHAGGGHAAAPIDSSLFVAGGMVEVPIVKEATVNAAPEKVFQAWTTTDGLKSFLGVESRIDLRIGGPMELYFGKDLPVGKRGSEGCQVLSYVPDRMFSFSWNAPPTLPEARTKRSWVVLTFTPVDGGKTLVRLEHTGFGKDGEWPKVKAYFDRAWGNVLKALSTHFDPALAAPATPPAKP